MSSHDGREAEGSDDGRPDDRSSDPSATGFTSSLDELQQQLASSTGSLHRRGEIARGGMGAILRVRDELLRRDLAMKVILGDTFPEEAATPTPIVQRFLEEAQITAQLDHPGVVPVHELGLDDEGELFFTMKLVKGRTLGDVFRSVAEGSDPEWTQARVLQVFSRICDTLAFAHGKGVIHRDLKPANIMVGKFGEVYVMDWGLAKVLGRETPAPASHPAEAAFTLVTTGRMAEPGSPGARELTGVGDILGTPLYIAPEQAAGLGVDARSDVYSIGAMLYQLLAGHAPYADPSKHRTARDVLLAQAAGPPTPLAERAPKAPPELVALATKAMARDPGERYASASDLGRDLKHFLEGRVVEAYRVGPLIEFRKWMQRNRAVAATAIAALALIGCLTTLFVFSVTHERDRALEAERLAGERSRRSRSMALAAASAEHGPAFPMQGLLLAREAVRMDANFASLSRLQEALARPMEAARLLGHVGPIRGGVFAPDGTRILTAGEDETARLWDLTGRELAVLRGHEDDLVIGAFSPDGLHIVTASKDGTARVWDAQGSELAVLRGHEQPLTWAGFSPQADRVLTASAEGPARVWDLAGGEQAVLRGHEEAVGLAAWSADGQRILTASADGTARIWSAAGDELQVLRGHTGPVLAAAFTPEGERIVTASQDGTARIWGHDGQLVALLKGHRGPILALDVSPVDGRIVTASEDESARLWSADGSDLGEFRPFGGQVLGVSFSADGERILTRSQGNRCAQVWTPDGHEVARLRGHRIRMLDAVFAPDRSHVLTVSRDASAWLWDLRAIDRGVLRGHESNVVTAVYSPQGDRILTSSRKGRARIWDTQGRQLASWDCTGAAPRSGVFSPDGTQVLIAGPDVRLWSVDGRPILTIDGHAGQVFSAVFSPDGRRILTGGRDRTARVWDLKGQELLTIDVSAGTVRWASFSPDGTRILVACGDGNAMIYDLQGRLLVRLEGHETVVWSAVYSPDGSRIVTASLDHTARLWDAEGHLLQVLRGRTTTVRWATFSPDGTQIVTVSGDGSARLWNADGTPRAAFRGSHGESRTRLAGDLWVANFSPDGTRLITGYQDEAARIWPLRTADLLALADERLQRDFTPEKRSAFAHLLDPDGR